jgi:hypothetical protein
VWSLLKAIRFLGSSALTRGPTGCGPPIRNRYNHMNSRTNMPNDIHSLHRTLSYYAYVSAPFQSLTACTMLTDFEHFTNARDRDPIVQLSHAGHLALVDTNCVVLTTRWHILQEPPRLIFLARTYCAESFFSFIFNSFGASNVQFSLDDFDRRIYIRLSGTDSTFILTFRFSEVGSDIFVHHDSIITVDAPVSRTQFPIRNCFEFCTTRFTEGYIIHGDMENYRYSTFTSQSGITTPPRRLVCRTTPGSVERREPTFPNHS